MSKWRQYLAMLVMPRYVSQRVLQECLAQMSQKVSTGESPLQQSIEDSSHACLTRVSNKSVSGVCPQRASYKSVQLELLAEVSFVVPQEQVGHTVRNCGYVSASAMVGLYRSCYFVSGFVPMDSTSRRPCRSPIPEAVQWASLPQASGAAFQMHFVEDFVYDTVLHSIPEFLQYQQDFLQTDVSKGCINSFMLNNLILETDSLDPFARRLDELSVPYFVFAIEDRPDYAAFILEFVSKL